MEEYGRISGSLTATFLAQDMVASLISEYGTEEQRQRYLPQAVRGEILFAFALTEPEHGSDAGGLQTTASRVGDEWVLNGQKVFITNGNIADLTIVAANTDLSKGSAGIALFLVENGTPGLNKGKNLEKMGIHMSETTELFFEDCRIRADNVLGGETSGGFKKVMVCLLWGRISHGGQSVGIAQGALERAISYAKQRVQFGQPISKHQAIQFKLVDMATRVDLARLAVHRAAWMYDHKQPCRKESSMAKLFASETAVWVTREAVHILGGYGFMKEYEVERYARDAHLWTITEGTSEMQRIMIARELGL
jgi:alkylation response protein AidB-like acyl-CoA dehydrogenase